MASTIINYLIDYKLNQFLEINPEETKTSLWNGTVDLNNIKFKKNIFESFNLPYIELVDGYIEKMKIKLQLPRFYLYPIKIELDKVFLHARQKSIQNLSKDKQIELIEKNKKEKLKIDEEFTIKLNQLKNESPGFLEQIINNLQIICQNVFIIFDDEFSYSKPFNIGLSLQKISYISTKKDFNDENINVNIEQTDIKFKRIRIREFSIFLDIFSSKDDLNHEKRIDDTELNRIDDNLKQYLKDTLNLYAYCMSELNIYGKDEKSHKYILYNLILDLKFQMNNNYKDNLIPKFFFDIIFPSISINLQISQIKALLGEKYNFDAKNYYQKGLEKEYYTKQYSEKDISLYIETYLKYYKTKYIEKYLDVEENEKYEKILKNLEEKVSYENIMNMRELCKIKIQYLNTVHAIDQKIEDAKISWDFLLTKEDEIKKLQKEREKILEEEKKLSKESLYDQILNIHKNFEEPEMASGDLVMYHVLFKIEKTNIIILEDEKKPLIKLETENFSTEIKLRLKSQWMNLKLEEISFYQFCTDNPYFNKILYSDSKGEKNILSIEFENNPKFEKSNLKLEIKNEKRLYIVINMFYINYLITFISKSFQNFDINTVALNASEEIIKYIQNGYSNLVIPGFSIHTNIDFNISLKCPLIIFPINFHDKNNNNVLFFSIGDIIIKSELPPRKNPNIDYINSKDESIIFDNYIFELSNMSAGTKNYFDLSSDENEKNIISKTNFSIKVSMKIEPKNKNFDNLIILFNLNNINIQITEEEIVMFVNFLENIIREKRLISLVQKELIEKINKNKEIIQQINKEIINEEENEEVEIENNIVTSKMINEKEKEKKVEKKEEEKKEEIKKEDKKEEIINSIKVKFRIGEFNISFLKSLTPEEDTIMKNLNNNNNYLTHKTFLTLTFADFNTNLKLKSNELLEIEIKLSGIYLYDNDYEILEDGNKKSYINQEFNCIFGSALLPTELNQNKFKLSEVIKLSKEQKENHSINILIFSYPNDNLSKIKIDINEFFICPNSSSLSRIYQYLIYYLNLYNESQCILKGEELKDKLSKLEIHGYEHELKGLFKELKEKKILRRALTEEIKKVKEEPLKKIIKFEKIETRKEIFFEIKNVDIIFPVDPNNLNTKVFILKFHNNISLISELKYENTFQNYEIIKSNYLINNLDISFSLTKGQMDIYYLNNNYIEQSKYKEFNFDNIFNNYSIVFKLKNNLEHSEKIVYTQILIITTPFNFVINSLYVSTIIKSIIIAIKYFDKFSNEYCSITTKSIIRRLINEESYISNELNKNKKVKKIKSNLDKYSFCQEIKGNIGEINFNVCDFFNGQYKSLINLKLSDINLTYFSNNEPKDSKNFCDSLVEMISGRKNRIDFYEPKSLFRYLEMSISLKMDYYNSNINQWESFIEPFDLNLKLIQVLKRMRQRIEINCDKMLNINISCNILKVIKILISKYQRINNIKEDEEKNDYILKKFSGIYKGNKVLKIINETGIKIIVIFDNNEHNKEIEIENEKSFTNNELNDSNVIFENNNSFNSTISFKYENNNPINFFNFSHNQIKNYEIEYGEMKLKILVSSYIDEESCKTIKFSSNILIHNYTQYNELNIVNSNNESINIKQDDFSSIPLSWLILNDKKLYLYFQQEKFVLCEDLSKPKEISECISFKNNISISLDYEILKDKYENEESNEFINIILNPPMLIVNNTPFKIKINDIVIDSSLKKSLYDIVSKKGNLIENFKNSNLKIIYENIDFNCKDVINENDKYLIIFSNEEKEISARIEIEEKNPLHYYNMKLLDSKNYKLNSLRIVFYFDFIFVNRTNNIISIKNEKNSFYDKSENNIIKLNPKQIFSINSKELNNNIQIKIDENDWTQKFQLETLGIDFVLKIKNTENKFIPIGVLIKPSLIYTNSTIIIFENRYNFINNIGIDIKYKEENSQDEELKKDEEKIILLNNENNTIFKIGIGNEYTENIDIESPGRYDLKIKVNKDEINDEKIKKQIYTLNNIDFYLPIRCIIQTYNKGIIYVMFTLLENPLTKIQNDTDKPIEITYNNNNIIIPPNKEIPFIIPKSIKVDKITVHLNGKSYNLSFNIFETIVLKTNEGEYKIQSTPTNSNLTKTILIKFFNKNEKFLYLKERIIQCFSSYSGYKLYIDLKGIGISIINQDPKDILYISLYKIYLEKKNITIKQINQNYEIFDNILFTCKNLQIDYCLDNSFKVILSPIQQILPSNEKELYSSTYNDPPVPFIQLCIFKQSKMKLNSNPSISYPSIELILQSLDLKIDHFILNQIFSLIFDLINSFGYEEDKNSIKSEDDNIKSNISTPKNLLNSENNIINSHAINFFNISSIYITLTFRLDKSSLKITSLTLLNHILSTLTKTLTSISDTQIRLGEIIISNIYTNFSHIFPLIINHYIRSILFQIYKIILGLDILGNPIKLLESIGIGVFELLNEPRKNFLRGPKNFTIGITKGLSSLLSNLLGGTTDTLSKITGTLLETTKTLQGEIKNNEIYEKKEEEPKGIIEGTYKGLKKGINEITSGVSGILTKPIEGTLNEGFTGLFKGIGKGILGAVLSPVNGVLSIGSNLTKGISNSNILNYKINFIRFREPRILSDNLPILEYEKMDVRNNDVYVNVGYGINLEISVQNLNLRLENSKKIIGKMFVNKGKFFVIISDVLIVFLKDFKVVFDKIYLSDIKECSVYNDNGKNVILFKMFNGIEKNVEIVEKKIADDIVNIIKGIKK